MTQEDGLPMTEEGGPLTPEEEDLLTPDADDPHIPEEEDHLSPEEDLLSPQFFWNRTHLISSYGETYVCVCVDFLVWSFLHTTSTQYPWTPNLATAPVCRKK
jgi:hypothetical protein